MRKKTTKKTMTEEKARAVLTGYGCICGKCEIAGVQAFYHKGFQVSAKCQSMATNRKLSTKDDFCSYCSHFVPIEGLKEGGKRGESGTGSPRSSDPKDPEKPEKK